jgi:hypothetical protein
MPGQRIAVTVHGTSPASLTRAARDALIAAGCEVGVTDNFVPKGPIGPEWLIQVGVKDTIEGFFMALGAAAFATFVRAVFGSSEGLGGGRLEVHDSDGTRLVLTRELPAAAVSALRDVDWSAVGGGSLTWRADRQTWESHTSRDSERPLEGGGIAS